MGISAEGVKLETDGELTVSEDDHGKVLRLALDGALRKMLPSLDKELLAHVETPPWVSPAHDPGVRSTAVSVETQDGALKRVWNWLTKW
jgi:hypothetical protein